MVLKAAACVVCTVRIVPYTRTTHSPPEMSFSAAHLQNLYQIWHNRISHFISIFFYLPRNWACYSSLVFQFAHLLQGSSIARSFRLTGFPSYSSSVSVRTLYLMGLWILAFCRIQICNLRVSGYGILGLLNVWIKYCQTQQKVVCCISF